MNPADQAVRRVFVSWFAAMQAGDVAAALSLVTDHVVMKFADAPALVGKDALGAALAEFYRTVDETVSFVVEEVGMSDDLAYARIAEHTSIQPKGGGQPFTASGAHLAILRRSAAGRWRIARDVISLESATAGGRHAPGPVPDVADVLQADDMRAAAARAGDTAALDRIYAEEFRLITSTGIVRTRRDQIEEYGRGRIRYHSFERLERDATVLGTAAIVWSRERAVIMRDGEDVGGDHRVTRVYVLRDGRWQLVTAHASPAA